MDDGGDFGGLTEGDFRGDALDGGGEGDGLVDAGGDFSGLEVEGGNFWVPPIGGFEDDGFED